MLTFSLLIGIVLTFWGGYDLGQYIEQPNRQRLVYTVLTTSLGIINLLLAAGVLQ